MSTHIDSARLLSLPAYAEQRRNIFPSLNSASWFVRQNRARLVEAGALLVVAGRKVVNAPAFDDEIIAIGREAAKRC